MTATATRITTTHRPSRGFTELPAVPAFLVTVAMSILLSSAFALSVIGASGRSGIVLPAPAPVPQPMTAPVVEPAPSVLEPETAPPGLDL